MLTDYFSCAPTKFLNGHVAFEVALEQVNQQQPLEVMSAAHMTQEKESEGCGEQCPRNDEGYRIVFHGGRFLIRTLAEVSRNVILCQLVDRSSLVDWNAAKGVSPARCPTAIASPVVRCFYPSNCLWLNVESRSDFT